MGLLSALREKAISLGFVNIGFIKPLTPPHFDRFVEWLSNGKCGRLTWLKRNVNLRQDPGGLLEGCRTVISMAFPYPAEKPCTPDGLTIARYASSPMDYHLVLKSKCRELADMLSGPFPGSKTRVLVDSAPILERSIAYCAGLGFIGKNNMFVVPGHGSYVHLAEILTTAPLDSAPPLRIESRCGECRRCIEACPTGALERPFFLDVSKCLAYLTVEYKGELPPESGRKMGNCFLGCDRCQEVCPFNRSSLGHASFLPSADEIMEMTEQQFSERFGRTALARAGLDKLKRNILALRSA